MFILNLNMPKTKWDGDEEPTINNFYTIDNRKLLICSSNCGLTEANRSISYQPKWKEILLGDKCEVWDSYGKNNKSNNYTCHGLVDARLIDLIETTSRTIMLLAILLGEVTYFNKLC